MKPRVTRWLAAFAVCLGGTVAACDDDPAPLGPPAPPAPGDDGRHAAPEVTRGPAVRIGTPGAYTGYNPRVLTAGPTDVLVANQVLVAPFVRDAGLRLLLDTDVMAGAESEKPDAAGHQRVTYRIEPGVRWSDGAAWDCDDLYLAWLAQDSWAVRTEVDGRPRYDDVGRPDRYFAARGDPAAPRSSGTCIDDLTFVETFEEPYADWRESYAGPSVLPAHVLEERLGIPDITVIGPEGPAPDLQRVADFWQTGWTGFDPATMPASGAYRIGSVEPGLVRLLPNPRFAGMPPGPAELVVVTVDAASVGETVQSGGVDVVALDPQLPEFAEALRELPSGIRSEVVGGGSFTHLVFNVDSPLGTDLGLRKAVAGCIDRAALADQLIREIDPLIVPRGSLLFPPGDPAYRDVYAELMVSNPDLSKFTLESAGWQLGPDAIYSRAGTRLRLPVLHDGSPRNQAVVEMIRARCLEAGVEIVGEVDPSGLHARTRDGAYVAALLTSPTWQNRSAPRSTYTSTGRDNISGLRLPEVDVAWQQVAALSDAGRRIELLREIDAAIAQSAADLPLFDVPIVVVRPEDLEGVQYQPVEGITWNANGWRSSR